MAKRCFLISFDSEKEPFQVGKLDAEDIRRWAWSELVPHARKDCVAVVELTDLTFDASGNLHPCITLAGHGGAAAGMERD